MKKLLHMALLGLWLMTAQAQVQTDKTSPKDASSAKASEEPKHKPSKQQEKMKLCNAEAKGMKGDERKAKMSACLKG